VKHNNEKQHRNAEKTHSNENKRTTIKTNNEAKE
jgi:hypothetical protein